MISVSRPRDREDPTGMLLSPSPERITIDADEGEYQHEGRRQAPAAGKNMTRMIHTQCINRI